MAEAREEMSVQDARREESNFMVADPGVVLLSRYLTSIYTL
jgi:hypothetical protein